MFDMKVWLLVCDEHGEMILTLIPHGKCIAPVCPFCGHGDKLKVADNMKG